MPILAVSLEVTEEVAAESVPLDLFVPEARAERALPRLVAELSAELGCSAIGVLAMADTWVTALRSHLVPYRAAPPSHGGSALVSAGEEMSRLLPAPRAVPRDAFTRLRLVARSEHVEWWKPGARAHDAFVAFWEEARRGGHGTAWISIDDRTGDALVHGWID